MATWGELKHFTWEELESFSWDELRILELNQLMYLKKVEVSENTQKQINSLQEKVKSLEMKYTNLLTDKQTPKAKDSSFQNILGILSAAVSLIQLFSSLHQEPSLKQTYNEIKSYSQELSDNLRTIIDLLQEDNINVIGQSTERSK